MLSQRNKIRLILVILFPLSIFSNKLSAEISDPCGCNAGLAPEILNQSSNSSLIHAFVKQIDESQFEQIDVGASTDGDIENLLRGSMNYSDFQERRRDFFAREDFSLSAEQSQSYILSTVRTSDWAACKRQCINRQTGFYCGISEFTSTHVAASCSWRPEGNAVQRSVIITVNGLEYSTEEILPNTSRDWQIPRESTKDLLTTFTLSDGSSRTLRVSKTPEPSSLPITMPVASNICFRHTMYGSRGLVDSEWVCAEDETTSRSIWLGDDTGYRNQGLEILSRGGDTEVCFRHKKRGVRGLIDSNLVCSKDNTPSQRYVIGDDTGYRDQSIELVIRGPGRYCLGHSRIGVRGEVQFESCFSETHSEPPIPLGDDTGYREQNLWFWKE